MNRHAQDLQAFSTGMSESDIVPTPEQLARQNIDALRALCDWIVQARAKMNLGAARSNAGGIAVREFPLKTGYADYLLFIDRRAIGAIEAKAEGTTLTNGSGVIQ
jgi:type I restriction enzyme, R subunit